MSKDTSTDQPTGESPEEVWAQAAKEYRTPMIGGDVPKSILYCLFGFLCFEWIGSIFRRH